MKEVIMCHGSNLSDHQYRVPEVNDKPTKIREEMIYSPSVAANESTTSVNIVFVNKSLAWIARPSVCATLSMALYASKNAATVI